MCKKAPLRVETVKIFLQCVAKVGYGLRLRERAGRVDEAGLQDEFSGED